MILIVFGTRPEYLKLKSTIVALSKKERYVLFFKQHASFVIDEPELIDETLSMKNVPIEKRCHQIVIDCMDYELPSNIQIKGILVQGDTTTAFSFGLWGFYHKIPVYHLEAGLRTNYKWEPYPEEINRRLLSQLATYHLCSSQQSVENLKKEGITENVILVGQTGLDLLHDLTITYEKKVMITMHRRENWEGMELWFIEIEKLAKQYPDYAFIFPIHWNPTLRNVAQRIFHTVKTIEPLNHREMIRELASCSLIITDSGGLQEEGSFLQKRIIVCRKETERPEVLLYYSQLCPEPSNLSGLAKTFIKNPIPPNSIYPYGYGKSYQMVINLLTKSP